MSEISWNKSSIVFQVLDYEKDICKTKRDSSIHLIPFKESFTPWIQHMCRRAMYNTYTEIKVYINNDQVILRHIA